MTTPQSQATLNMLLDGIDAPRALVILVDDEGNIETAEKNLGPENMMLVCFSMAVQLAQEIKARRNIPDLPRQRAKPLIYLPPDLQRKLDEL